MKRFLDVVSKLFGTNNEKGVTAVEYGLIAALIACVIVLGVTTVGKHLNTEFQTIGKQLVGPSATSASNK